MGLGNRNTGEIDGSKDSFEGGGLKLGFRQFGWGFWVFNASQTAYENYRPIASAIGKIIWADTTREKLFESRCKRDEFFSRTSENNFR